MKRSNREELEHEEKEEDAEDCEVLQYVPGELFLTPRNFS